MRKKTISELGWNSTKSMSFKTPFFSSVGPVPDPSSYADRLHTGELEWTLVGNQCFFSHLWPVSLSFSPLQNVSFELRISSFFFGRIPRSRKNFIRLYMNRIYPSQVRTILHPLQSSSIAEKRRKWCSTDWKQHKRVAQGDSKTSCYAEGKDPSSSIFYRGEGFICDNHLRTCLTKSLFWYIQCSLACWPNLQLQMLYSLV